MKDVRELSVFSEDAPLLSAYRINMKVDVQNSESY
jgi:hypothetical protein